MLTLSLERVVDHPCIRHRSMEMTLTYARIAGRVVADEYEAVPLRSTPSTTPPVFQARCRPRSRLRP